MVVELDCQPPEERGPPRFYPYVSNSDGITRPRDWMASRGAFPQRLFPRNCARPTQQNDHGNLTWLVFVPSPDPALCAAFTPTAVTRTPGLAVASFSYWSLFSAPALAPSLPVCAFPVLAHQHPG